MRFVLKHPLLLFTLLLGSISLELMAQNTSVQIDNRCERYIGNESELDRTKYFSIHDASNDTEAVKFRNDYNVTGGRQFWGPHARAKQVTGEVGAYPSAKSGDDNLREVKKGYVSTQHPRDAFIDGLDVNAAADWAVEYFKNDINNGDAQEFFELMNEPFVHAKDFYSGWSVSENNRIKKQMAEFYGAVGKRIHETPALANMKVIGYSSAWPSMELNDFGHWKENMMMFMDVAGDNMYGFSTHLYDGINVTGQDTKRSGSNSEAILDLIETYSFAKWGIVKPHAITEYGAIEKGYGDDYSEIASAQTMTSINHILLSLLDRQDRITCSIPFITGKATWHITEANNYQPYTPVLWIPKNIGQPIDSNTEWEYSPRILFYELWKDVKGKRIFIKSDNPDVQTHAFVDGNKMFIALSNLDDNTQLVNLTMMSSVSNFVDVKIKSLKVYKDQLPELDTKIHTTAPSSLSLIKDETVILEYSFSSDIKFNNAIRTKNYYTTKHLQAITANTPIAFNFNGVTSGIGFATLRLGIGRKHNVSKRPVIKVNDKVVEVPGNWKGYDQTDRDDFFGMIEVPFSSSLLKENNIVSVEFPDNGGSVSSLILSVETYDKVPSGGAVAMLKTTSVSCKGKSNGTISAISIVSGTYNIKITGDGVNILQTFTDNFTLENLKAGTYTVTITSPTDVSLSMSAKLIINEPESLSVFSKVNHSKKLVTLNLKGSDIYRIEVNDSILVTDKSSIILNLQSDYNTVRVSTDKDCQGVYNETIIFSNAKVLVFPTIVEEILTIALLNIPKEPIAYKVVSMTGELVLDRIIDLKEQMLNVNLNGLSSGVYFLHITNSNINIKTKIIKK
ncbi:T9SS type A sorting domain-containing protein [Tamlana fucoidanivorans]|uniref:T9SS type A sorting domain-containing protein n=1 Tax=Allotamlana fucoidanivorans TaxID=2583814 RepID=A0A5C4SQP4_9FLAO|nr:T9SS type A sorting domain-containing protein [Tamlana fucoidanivorans]TNJ46585.1 T9SS type A sorting domain-containing protein [Tamlana fucoidanivorans]